MSASIPSDTVTSRTDYAITADTAACRFEITFEKDLARRLPIELLMERFDTALRWCLLKSAGLTEAPHFLPASDYMPVQPYAQPRDDQTP